MFRILHLLMGHRVSMYWLPSGGGVPMYRVECECGIYADYAQ